MSIIRSYKRSRWKGIIYAGMVTVFLSALAGMVLMYQKLEECQMKLNIQEKQLVSCQRTVYSALENLPKGTVINEENVCQEIRYIDIPQEELISRDELGMTLNYDVKAGTCLMVSMLEYNAEKSREVFVSEVELSEFFQIGDRVDIRIRYDNAEDYTVLADKILVNCIPSKGMVIELSDKEILLLSSAIADKNEYKDTKLYAVKYPENKQQESGRVTYIAKREILRLLGKEKTEGESRAALEERLMQK